MPLDDTLFTPDDRSDLTALARALYPHNGLSAAPYERTTTIVINAAATDPALYRLLQDGLTELRTAGASGIAATPTPGLQEMLTERETTPFFDALRRLVAFHLYDDREVWEFVGYPGAAFELGGYLNRGFNDLDWLPEPRIEEPAEDLLEIGPLTESELTK
jgi:hypothetical protein